MISHAERHAGIRMRKLFLKLRFALYWLLPPVILYLIFRQIDLARLLALGATANPWLFFLGVSLIIPRIFAGAMRWHHLARSFDCTRFALGRSFREYWFSIALGLFTPGSLGSDVYRVALGGRQTGRYLRNAYVIGVEKSAALLSCVVLIAGIYPFLTVDRVSNDFAFAVHAAYAASLLGLGLVMIVGLAHRSLWARSLANTFWQRFRGLAKRAVSAMPAQSVQSDVVNAQPHELLQTLFSLRIALPTIALSVAIHVLGAIQGQVFLQALGYDLPFLVNLFIAPLSVLVLTLPITVGGIGVREGAFILFYGAFGVPVEIALLLSFCGFLSVMVGHAIGGLTLLVRERRG